jgi:hypothetical protein
VISAMDPSFPTRVHEICAVSRPKNTIVLDELRESHRNNAAVFNWSSPGDVLGLSTQRLHGREFLVSPPALLLWAGSRAQPGKGGSGWA